ncbi:MAG: DUF3592 domain-containing protein [Streptosporangiales bacterium]|nr:DUF3592 domain-containing protein [Streptosporangiales bacterium]
MFSFLPVVLTAAGVGTFGYGLYRVVSLWLFRRRAIKVGGVVMDIRIRVKGGQVIRSGYHPVLAFRTVDGRDVQAEAKNYSRSVTDYQVGDQVGVRYDPRDPRTAYADTELMTELSAVLVVVAGCVFLVVGLLAFGNPSLLLGGG